MESSFGALTRYWRRVRAMSQLDLASAAMTTPRHMSFLETGRSNPSREMVLRLAGALDVPLRDRNGMLLAAGFAPLFAHSGLDDPALRRVVAAIDQILDRHDPLPAVVLDRGWNLVRANQGAAHLFGTLFAPAPIPEDANVLRLIIEPGPIRDAVANWDEVVPALLERARREAVGGVLDLVTAELVQELRSRTEVEALIAAPRTTPAPIPIVDVHFRLGGAVVRFFSVVSTIGTPVDVTAQELRVEAFFPSDDESTERWSADFCASTPGDDDRPSHRRRM
ncbi:MmyB family transcriptional regulator [Nonomuraea endophytica]|uniref:MmyB family transcriptional regulator n=1 Tax=Nonomuraea endophytica TaxID=714136 RepID=UPI0037C98025